MLVRELDDIVRRESPPLLGALFDTHAPTRRGATRGHYDDGTRHIDAAFSTALDHARSGAPPPAHRRRHR
ncbi:MAG: hypothetical protein IPF99_33415 [Deltaproteobacteria bacterium]|nr:hypothetical protein [Deltaproteobacteria bacterium]